MLPLFTIAFGTENMLSKFSFFLIVTKLEGGVFRFWFFDFIPDNIATFSPSKKS